MRRKYTNDMNRRLYPTFCRQLTCWSPFDTIQLDRGENHSLEIFGNPYPKSEISYAWAERWEILYAKCGSDLPLELDYLYQPCATILVARLTEQIEKVLCLQYCKGPLNYSFNWCPLSH